MDQSKDKQDLIERLKNGLMSPERAIDEALHLGALNGLGTFVPDEQLFHTRNCQNCGQPTPANGNFCSHCGVSIHAVIAAPKDRSQPTNTLDVVLNPAEGLQRAGQTMYEQSMVFKPAVGPTAVLTHKGGNSIRLMFLTDVTYIPARTSDKSVICPSCGHETSTATQACVHCGKPLPGAEHSARDNTGDIMKLNEGCRMPFDAPHDDEGEHVTGGLRWYEPKTERKVSRTPGDPNYEPPFINGD